jgi:EAL domain-containing protein (putative c-di-GMP-specific phosphodiesterase class I)/ActR/RegA family two-component response regulator
MVDIGRPSMDPTAGDLRRNSPSLGDASGRAMEKRTAMTKCEDGRLLLVDDDQAILKMYQNVLGPQGWKCEVARDGLDAKRLTQDHSFDVIICDINMPGYGGLAFLRLLRERDLDVPVILVTGTPSIDSTIRAIEHGVFRYLVKPVANGVLVETVSRAARFHKLAQLKRKALEIAGADGHWLDNRIELESRFARGIDLLWIAFQPIVSWRDRSVFGYEALLRSDEPALASPLQFIETAEKLGKVHELGRAIRAKIAEASRQLPTHTQLFINLHASDLDDENLRDSLAPLSGIAHRVVLEITERASLEGITDAARQIRALKAMGFRIAVDDLGAGYAGLSSFAQLEPEVVKLDMSLVRGLDAAPNKQAVVGAMRKLCDELGMLVVAEGVETPAERETLLELGCDLLQGYLFARPTRGFLQPTW